MVVLYALEHLQLGQEALDRIFPHPANSLEELASKDSVAHYAYDLVNMSMCTSAQLPHHLIRKRFIFEEPGMCPLWILLEE
jgi:hypothetical protein